MATLSLNLTVLPDQKATDILNAFCVAHSYQAGSGLTKAQFLKEEIRRFIVSAYIDQRRQALDAVTLSTIDSEVSAIAIT